MKKTISIGVIFLLSISLFAQKPFKGGEIYSKDRVLYGKFEMRMKMIKGDGMLSTFYTLQQGSKKNKKYWAELDIEVLGKNNAQIMSTNIIIDDPNGELVHNVEEIQLDSALSEDFHTYVLEWTPTYVAWYIDGVEYRRETGTVINHLNIPQEYRFNAWISDTPAWVGNIDKKALPNYQYVDWVQYSSYNESTNDFTLEWRDDFNTFDKKRWKKADWTFEGNEVNFVHENVYIQNGKLVLAITDPNPTVETGNKQQYPTP